MAYKAEMSVHVITSVFRGFDYPAMVDRLRPDLPDLRLTVVLDAPGEEPFTARDGFVRWDEFLAGSTPAADEDWAARRPDPREVWLLRSAAAATGDPRGVMHPHTSVLTPLGSPVVPEVKRMSPTSFGTGRRPQGSHAHAQLRAVRSDAVAGRTGAGAG